MSNYIPNEIIKIRPRDPPWITPTLKTLLNRQNRLYKNFKRHGFKPVDKIRVDNFNVECMNAIREAKESYLINIGGNWLTPIVVKRHIGKFLIKY